MTEPLTTKNSLAEKLRTPPKCRCMAWSATECCCDTSWPSHYIKQAADELDRLTYALSLANSTAEGAIGRAEVERGRAEMFKTEVAEMRRALRQIINGCVDLDDGYNELFRLWPEEIRKLAKAALGEKP